MRYDQVPDHGLECLGMRGDRLAIDGGHDHTCVRDFRGITAVAADYSVDVCASFAREAKRLDQVVTDAAFGVAPADREYQDRVTAPQPADGEPARI